MPNERYDKNAEEEDDTIEMERIDQSSQLPQDRSIPEGKLGKL